MDFVHLHMHTEYSLLDGANKIEDLVKRVKELGMGAVAITDHGNMFGAVEMYKECKKQGIKPIIGCEMYVVPKIYNENTEVVRTFKDPNHLILLAMNNIGYQNLVKLVSISYTDGFYYKPRIDIDLLKKYNEGLIALSGCMAGAVAQKILEKDLNGAKQVALEYKNIFNDRYYLELQDNKYTEQMLINQNLIGISKELSIPLVATNDCHYLMPEDYFSHDVLLCIQTKKKLSDEDRMRFKTNEFYVKSKEEMENAFKFIPEAISNTVKIADMCNVELEFGKYLLPEFVTGENISNYDYFKKMCYGNISKKYPKDMYEKVKERLEYELDVISKMGFIDYFLIVADFVNYAKSQGIAVGPGRGSGAGSIAAYLSNITEIDPLKFNLIFERFLNPERISMPDFDIDFCVERRQEVIDYVSRKYGADHVAQIITFGTLKSRAVIRDVARVMDMPYAKADEIAKLVPLASKDLILQMLDKNEKLKKMYEEDIEVKKIIDISQKLEGMPRHASTHAAGIVITPKPVSCYVPLYLNQNQIATQYTMTALEELGILKMDFLGLRTLTVIQDTVRQIKEKYGKDIDFSNMEYTDKNVYLTLSSANTVGIFQMESFGFRKVLKELKPENISEITVMLALYRPGPMDQIDKYIEAKFNPEKITYMHEKLIPILKETNGCIVYQEQVMQIFRDLAGYTFGRADVVRRAMGKKKMDVLKAEEEIFISGCKKNNIDEKTAINIFATMIDFAKYAFNKSHASAYAYVAYQTAYLKTYYPAEFLAANMNSFTSDLTKIAEYIEECKRLKIKVKKPNINYGASRFISDNNEINFGLSAIKNVGQMAIDSIVNLRETSGKFTSLVDFLTRINTENVNKRCIESLIMAGAMDELEPEYTRYEMLESFERILDTVQNSKKNTMANQISLFDTATPGDINQFNDVKIEKNNRKITEQEMAEMEKEMLGIYISSHPLDAYSESIRKLNTITCSELAKGLENDDEILEAQSKLDGKICTICGILSSVKTIMTKSGKPMCFAKLEDMYGEVEIVIFPTIYEKNENILQKNAIVCVKGKINIGEEENKILVENISVLEREAKVYIKICDGNIGKIGIDKADTEFEVKTVDKVIGLICEDLDNIPVFVYFEKTGHIIKLARKWWVNDSINLRRKFEAVFGADNVKYVS